MSEIFNLLLFQNTLRTATPVVLCALGCLMTERVGIMNIGVEGMMLLGAFFAVLGSYLYGSWVMGLAFVVVLGIILGLFYYLFSIKLKSDEFVIGVAINILAGGLTVFLLRTLFGVKGSFSGPGIVPLPTLHFAWLESIRCWAQSSTGTRCWFTSAGYWCCCAGFCSIKRRWVSTCGHPERRRRRFAPRQKPDRMKMLASVLCGILASLSGAHLSLGYLTMFSENMSASRGFVAVACVIFGGGNPPRVFLAALLFGFIDALGLRLQRYIPADITAMAPYVVTVIMMVAVVLMKRRKKRLQEVR